MADIRSIYGTNDRTLTSITTTLMPAVRWATETTAATTGDAPLDDPHFLDIPGLVTGHSSGRFGSLYLIGRDGTSRPLVGALTAEIAHQARMAASETPSGRLDPPLTMVLDEAPLTCGPIPLQDWTADMGGRGVWMHIGAQSLAQLRDVWGRDRADAILGNVASLMAFGGIKAANDLNDLSTLAGTRLVQLDDDDRRPIPVMTPAQISQLPIGVALVLRNGLRPVIGKAPLAWQRRRPLATRVAPLTRTVTRLGQTVATRIPLPAPRRPRPEPARTVRPQLFLVDDGLTTGGPVIDLTAFDAPAADGVASDDVGEVGEGA